MTTGDSVSRSRDRKRGGLAARIRWAFLSFAIVSLLVVGATLIYSSYRAQQQALSQSQGKAAEAVALSISSYLRAALREMQLFEQTKNLTALDSATQQAALEDLLAYRGDVLDELGLLDSEGNEIVKVSEFLTYLPGDLASRAGTPLFEAARQGNSFIGSVYLSQYSLPMVTVAVPVHDEEGQVWGALLAEMSIRQMWKTVAEVELGETGYAYIVDPNGQLLAHKTLATFFAHQFEDLSDAPEVREALTEGQQRAPDLYEDFTGQRVTSANAPIQVENVQWVAVIATPVQEAYVSIYNMLLLLGGVLVVALLLAAVVGTLIPRAIIRPLNLLAEGASIIGAGDLGYRIQVATRDEIGLLAQAFNHMADRLRGLVGTLEQRVADRTRDLEKRSVYLEAAAEVGRAVTSIIDADKLIRQVVELIRERFGLYYVGLFLADEQAEWAVLRAGTGDAGRAMLARGHRIQVGEGMIGWSVAHAEARVALEVGSDAVRLASPELPDTRSEAALPLRSRGQVLGALTVQHVESGAFDPDTLAVLQTMADQVAVALDNARLFAQSQAALEAERRAYGEIGRQAWAELLQTWEGRGYLYAQQAITSARGEWRPEMLRAQRTGQIVQSNGGEGAVLAVPIKLRDQVLGVLRLNKGTSGETWSPDEVALLEELALQLSVALESARLYSDTQRRASREQMMGELTARMRESLDVETVLKTAVREMREALSVAEVEVHLTAEGE